MEPLRITVTIPEPLLPRDRDDLIQPVVAMLEAAQLGTYGGDAGTRLGSNREIVSIDFTLQIEALDAIALITQTLDELGVPQGSRLAYVHDGKRVEVPFGTTQAVTIFIDTSDLAALQGQTPDRLVQAIEDAGAGTCRYGRPSANELGLHFYGEDAEAMFTLMQPVLGSHPLGRLARVVVRHGGTDPREVRIASGA